MGTARARAQASEHGHGTDHRRVARPRPGAGARARAPLVAPRHRRPRGGCAGGGARRAGRHDRGRRAPRRRRRRRAPARARGGAGPRIDLLVNNASVLGPSPQPRLADYPLDVLEHVYRVNVLAPLALVQSALWALPPGACVINVTSDAAVEAYEGWGGYGSSKAALEQLTRVLAAEHPELRIVAVDPGDMNTQLHQEAFPGEDISDRPPPEASVPGLLAIVYGDAPSGRYQASAVAPRMTRAGVRASRRPSRPASATTSACWSPRGPGSATTASSTSPICSSPATCWSSTPPRPSPRRSRAARASTSRPRSPRRRRVPDDGHERWVIELRDGDARHRAGRAGQRIELPGGGEAELLAPYLGGRSAVGRAADAPGAAARLPRRARPTDPLPPPARAAPARRLPDDLRHRARQRRDAERRAAVQRAGDRGARGPRRRVATIVLHTGVSSLERGERPYPERFRVPQGTLAAVRARSA